MADDYDPSEFQVRVSPELFEALAGRVSGHSRVDPANAREAALVDATRVEEARKVAGALGREAAAAGRREEVARAQVDRAYRALDDKLSTARVRLAASADDLPCAKSRGELMACFRAGNALACKAEVGRFNACARRVAELEE